MQTIVHHLSYKTTIQDIARELNLTSATISRALHNNPRISEQTRKLVLDTAKKLNYSRNRIASSLRSGKSHTIGVIIPTAQRSFFGSVVHGIQSEAKANGYSILLYQSEETTELEIKAIEAFLGARVDGILASIANSTTDFSHFEDLKRRKIPLVFFDRANDALDIPCVVIDDYRGAYNATEHLIKQGYKRIAHVSGQKHIKIFRERMEGYKDALRAHGMEVKEEYIFTGDISIERGKKAVDYYFDLDEPPDAFFAVEDYTALGVMKRLRERDKVIPDEFGVIGFANESFSEYMTPSLSTVDQQTVQMGKEAFSVLKDLIGENGVTANIKTKVVLEPVLYCRQSSLKTGAEQA
ncbi:MAG TPA: LacI family DNA-binding transcriptional regulator [Chitinophagaceae bacterium]|nr:LacI family DNA-binding transcriptional regulator [Chitinophagaceae bacterium]